MSSSLCSEDRSPSQCSPKSPGDNEENRRLFAEARSLLLEVLRRGIEALQDSDDEELDDREDPEEGVEAT
ncbi:MAG TPA: hypothetical protein VMU38_01680 [Candidatus Binatia bacterium]|nr:hypothetical protein [Candidatus Binatia bacterium]